MDIHFPTAGVVVAMATVFIMPLVMVLAAYFRSIAERVGLAPEPVTSSQRAAA